MNNIKIDLITLHAVYNYGSFLQAFATQELLKSHHCDVKIINYQRNNIRPENVLKSWSGNNPIKRLVMLPTVRRWCDVFIGAQKKYLNLTDEVYTTEDDFKTYPLTADAYCTGSDQVWNSKWNGGILPQLYLSFVPEKTFKFSLSASFGAKELCDSEVRKTQSLIDQYRYISVRESSAVDILRKQYGYQNVTQLVDPTLAVTPEFWRQYETKRSIKEDYILIYNLNRSREFDNYAIELAKRTGLKLVRLCTRYDQFYRPGKSILVPAVFDFVSLIDNARYVLTDSFHATAFSMNLNTEPICIYPSEFGGRLESFLTLTGSLQRHAESYNDFDVLHRPVDFKQVNKILDEERARVDRYLSIVLDEIRKGSPENENGM